MNVPRAAQVVDADPDADPPWPDIQAARRYMRPWTARDCLSVVRASLTDVR
ncbi:hypothetical protein GCM10009735_48670 [Actinomadura chokoriensis]